MIEIDIQKNQVDQKSILSLGVNVLFKLIEKLFTPQSMKEFKETLRSIKIDVDFLYNMLGGVNFL